MDNEIPKPIKVKKVRVKKERVKSETPYVYVPETINDYFGVEMTLDDCNIVASWIPTKQMIKDEPALMSTKWFDYRGMHPTHLGYLWAFYYREAYKRFTAAYRDAVIGQYVNGIAGKDVFGLVGKGKNMKLCPSAKAVWRARQMADKHGIPYDFYIRAVLTHADKTGWVRAPRPQHMYSEDMVSVALEAWESKNGTQIVTAENKSFLAVNYEGKSNQRDYQMYLASSIKKRARREFGVHYCMIEKEQLLEEFAVKLFGETVVNKAKKLSLN